MTLDDIMYSFYRFSSGDLSSELEDGPDGAPMGSPPAPQTQPQPLSTTAPPPVTSGPPGPPNSGDLSLNLTKQSSRTTSAPSSPAKTRESLLQRVQSLTGVARDQGASLIGNVGTYHQRQLLIVFGNTLLQWFTTFFPPVPLQNYLK